MTMAVKEREEGVVLVLECNVYFCWEKRNSQACISAMTSVLPNVFTTRREKPPVFGTTSLWVTS